MCKIVIQGTIEAGGKLTKSEIARSVDFCTSVIEKVESGCLSDLALENKPGAERGAAPPPGADDRCDATIMKIVRTNRVLDLDHFAVDVVNGMAPSMKRGHLGLVMASAAA